MKDKILVRKNGTIAGYVFRIKNRFYYAFGKPAKAEIAFPCKNIDEGINLIYEFT